MTVTFLKKSAPLANGAGGRIIGIDPSTKTGVVVMEGNTVLVAHVLTAPNLEGYARLQSIAEGVLANVLYWEPKFVFVEKPISNGKFLNPIQGQIACLIRDRLYSAGRDWFDVSPTSLKKWVTGKGHADKKMMLKCVQARWQYWHKDDNVIDGYALARLGQFVVAQGLPTKFKGVEHEEV